MSAFDYKPHNLRSSAELKSDALDIVSKSNRQCADSIFVVGLALNKNSLLQSIVDATMHATTYHILIWIIHIRRHHSTREKKSISTEITAILMKRHNSDAPREINSHIQFQLHLSGARSCWRH